MNWVTELPQHSTIKRSRQIIALIFDGDRLIITELLDSLLISVKVGDKLKSCDKNAGVYTLLPQPFSKHIRNCRTRWKLVRFEASVKENFQVLLIKSRKIDSSRDKTNKVSRSSIHLTLTVEIIHFATRYLFYFLLLFSHFATASAVGDFKKSRNYSQGLRPHRLFAIFRHRLCSKTEKCDKVNWVKRSKKKTATQLGKSEKSNCFRVEKSFSVVIKGQFILSIFYLMKLKLMP